MKIICLHGFGGDRSDWLPIITAAEKMKVSFSGTVDGWEILGLPGHGEELSCQWLGIKNFSDAVAYLRKKIEKIVEDQAFILCGYSMGGRLALSLSVELSPSGLILLSSGLGLEGESERVSRQKNDQEWEQRFSQLGANAWRDWYRQPVFSGSQKFLLSPKGLEWQRSKRHNYPALGEALKILSPSGHGSLLGALQSLKCPLLYLAGNQDPAYLKVADSVRLNSPSAMVEKIQQVGHILPMEAPGEVAQAIQHWRKKNGI